MSSFPDSDVRTSVGVPTGSTAPEDVLARVKTDGLRRRTRRHRRNSVLAALGLAIVAVPAIALLPGDDGNDDVTVAADSDARPTPTTNRRRTTTTTPSTVAPTTATTLPTVTTIIVDGDEVGLIPPTSVVRRPTPTTAPPTTAPAPVCRNSMESACGDFRWDPAPAPNQPLSLGFVDSPASAVVGEPVVFNVVWSDPDATLSYDNFSADGVGLGQACAAVQRFGPWTPPDPAGGSGELTYQHTFSAPGTYTVVVSAGTADCNSPYGNDATAEIVVTVS